MERIGNNSHNTHQPSTMTTTTHSNHEAAPTKTKRKRVRATGKKSPAGERGKLKVAVQEISNMLSVFSEKFVNSIFHKIKFQKINSSTLLSFYYEFTKSPKSYTGSSLAKP